MSESKETLIHWLKREVIIGPFHRHYEGKVACLNGSAHVTCTENLHRVTCPECLKKPSRFDTVVALIEEEEMKIKREGGSWLFRSKN